MNIKRHELACKAHEEPTQASLQQLLDGLAMRLETIEKEHDGDLKEGARYVATLLISEIARRHQIKVRLH